jgi:hypothetical protein
MAAGYCRAGPHVAVRQLSLGVDDVACRTGKTALISGAARLELPLRPPTGLPGPRSTSAYRSPQPHTMSESEAHRGGLHLSRRRKRTTDFAPTADQTPLAKVLPLSSTVGTKPKQPRFPGDTATFLLGRPSELIWHFWSPSGALWSRSHHANCVPYKLNLSVFTKCLGTLMANALEYRPSAQSASALLLSSPIEQSRTTEDEQHEDFGYL